MWGRVCVHACARAALRMARQAQESRPLTHRHHQAPAQDQPPGTGREEKEQKAAPQQARHWEEEPSVTRKSSWMPRNSGSGEAPTTSIRPFPKGQPLNRKSISSLDRRVPAFPQTATRGCCDPALQGPRAEHGIIWNTQHPSVIRPQHHKIPASLHPSIIKSPHPSSPAS